MGVDFGDIATGVVADENDWSQSGPRIISPRRVVIGTVVGLFADCDTAVKVRTENREEICIRIISYTRARPFYFL